MYQYVLILLPRFSEPILRSLHLIFSYNMKVYDDLDTYNGDPVHDGGVDFDYNENTGELSELFDESDLDQFIDNLNDWD